MFDGRKREKLASNRERLVDSAIRRTSCGDHVTGFGSRSREEQVRWTRRMEIVLAVGFPLLAALGYLLFYGLGL